jgi:hypothetical protein
MWPCLLSGLLKREFSWCSAITKNHHTWYFSNVFSWKVWSDGCCFHIWSSFQYLVRFHASLLFCGPSDRPPPNISWKVVVQRLSLRCSIWRMWHYQANWEKNEVSNGV